MHWKKDFDVACLLLWAIVTSSCGKTIVEIEKIRAWFLLYKSKEDMRIISPERVVLQDICLRQSMYRNKNIKINKTTEFNCDTLNK